MRDSPVFKADDVVLNEGITIRCFHSAGGALNLVLLHPSSGYGRMWELTASHLDRRFSIYAPDQRGHGDSSRPDGEYSAEELARDLRGVVDMLGLQHSVDHNMNHAADGKVTVKYDPVRVAEGLTHQLIDLKKYAAAVKCPTAFIRATGSAEMTPEAARDVARFWTRTEVDIYSVEA